MLVDGPFMPRHEDKGRDRSMDLAMRIEIEEEVDDPQDNANVALPVAAVVDNASSQVADIASVETGTEPKGGEVVVRNEMIVYLSHVFSISADYLEQVVYGPVRGKSIAEEPTVERFTVDIERIRGGIESVGDLPSVGIYSRDELVSREVVRQTRIFYSAQDFAGALSGRPEFSKVSLVNPPIDSVSQEVDAGGRRLDRRKAVRLLVSPEGLSTAVAAILARQKFDADTKIAGR